MPQAFNPGDGQDWAPVNAGRGGPMTKKPTTARGVDRAKAMGLVATEKRFGAGGNKSAHTGATVFSARKLEDADDVVKIAKVDKSLSKAIMQARMAKGITQKDLATAVNEKPQVVGEYESGKAIPNAQIISKLERKLGVKLPRPGKAKAPPKSSAAGGKTAAAKSGGATRGGPTKRR
jgi:putative transcription factor